MDVIKTRSVGRAIARKTVVLLTIVLLASCRLVITTDDKGHIVSASGSFDCDQPSCAFPITEKVTETFTAVAAEGYRFVRWKGLCRRAPSEVCTTKIAPPPEKFKEFDGDIGILAVFESAAVRKAWYRDGDGDFYGTPNQSLMAFERPEGYAVNKADCDDEDETVYPGAEELEDGRDNNCNGDIDEGFFDKTRFYLDHDGDGFGDADVTRMETEQPEGYVRNGSDCNDSDPSENPEAEEVLDSRDNDCDGKIDEGANEYFRDVDGDGFGVRAGAIESLEPVEGYVANDDDCDDNNDRISPAAEEQFDGIDNDCDRLVDEGFTPRVYYRDADRDGFGDRSDPVEDVTRPEGYVANSGDNCVEIYNPEQSDIDEDGIGDACDPFTDTDGDGIQDSEDNCPEIRNSNQRDQDEDGVGDACDERNDLDVDIDGISNVLDNCPETYNPDQADSDGDDRGDVCDEVDDSEYVGDDEPCAMTAEDWAMLDTVNAYRSEARQCGDRGYFPAVSPLTWRCELKMAALNHSMDMANNNFFSHTGSDGDSAGDRIGEAGYSWSAWGENIAAGIPVSSVSAVVQGWIDSPGHCANVMGSHFTNLGAAKYSNGSSTYNVYWTQVFGRPY